MPKRAFTQSLIDELGDKPTLARHPALRGFAVRVLPSGQKRFVIEEPPRSGKFKALPEPFRDAGTVLLKDAYDEARRLLLAQPSGGGLVAEREQDRKLAKAEAAQHRTFEDAYNEWWAATADDMPPTTRATYRSQWNKRLRSHFDKRLLTAIEPSDIAAFRDKWKPISRSSANMSLSVISLVYSYALEQGWVKTIPTFKVKRLHEEHYSPELTEEQVQTLFHAFKVSDDEARHTAMLCTFSGCRRDEAEGIKLKEIVPYRGGWIWRLKPPRTKQRQRHEIPLIGEELEIARAAAQWVPQYAQGVQHRRDDTDPLNVSLRRFRMGTLFERERERLGLPECSPHVLRHRYITDALENGELPALLAIRTGQTIATLMKYAGRMSDAVVQLAERQHNRRGLV